MIDVLSGGPTISQDYKPGEVRGGTTQPTASSTASSAQVSQQAMMLKSGDVCVGINAESRQVVFWVEGNDQIKPVAIDLLNGLILNASFPYATSDQVDPDELPVPM
jgi:hypothetical protein